METVPVWKKGQPIPADLESGDYILTFIGDKYLAGATAVTLDLLRGKRIPYLFSKHALTINRVDAVDAGAGQSLLSVTCTLEGFPWSGLLVVLSAAFLYLSLITVERMLKSGAAGTVTVVLLAVAAAAAVGFLVWRSGDQ